MKLEELTRPIRPESIEEHERIIKERMFRIELEYIDGLASGKIKPLSTTGPINNIRDLLAKHTEILGNLRSSYLARAEDKFDDEAFFVFKNQVLDLIAGLYKANSANWMDKAEHLI